MAFSTKRFLLTSFVASLLSVAGCQQELISQAPASQAQGIKAFNAGDYADAAGSFRNAIRSDPRDYKSKFYLGQCYEQLHQDQQALEAYKSSLDAQTRTLEGQADQAQRQQTLDALASAIARADSRDTEINAIQKRAEQDKKPQDYLLLGKINEDRGDADSALDAYNRAFILAPKDFDAAKAYGLYLAKVGQDQKAAQTLRKAYVLNGTDSEVNNALRRLNVIPGPALKDEDQLAKPPLPQGPLPEVDLSKFKIGASDQSQQPAPSAQPVPSAQPAPSAQPTPTGAPAAPRD